jgi:S-formylglutathione hydrolase FrmB
VAVLADRADSLQGRISLTHGWVPVSVQVVAGLMVLLAIGWRTRRWRLVWLPMAAGLGAAAAWITHRIIISEGLAGSPAPDELWVWVSASGLALGVLIFGWRGAPWWRRGAAATALPVCLLSVALAVNIWAGYFPTVQTAWNQLTAGPLPDQADRATVAAISATVRAGHLLPRRGSVIKVDIPSTASGFRHRGELVYLPPVWFATSPPPRLPTVMMIGGEFSTPADWIRAGNAVQTVDTFAAAHGGNAPVLVFVDSGGAFDNDTECVNGPRGRVADHLTKDVVPFMSSHFGVSTDSANWGVAGWSMGGTCAVDLAVMHPEMFGSFVDIAGDIAPSAGTRSQTVARLYGGDTALAAQFDPVSVITKHGPYQGVSGWFAVNARSGTWHPVPVADIVPAAGSDAAGLPGDQMTAAEVLCALGAANGIDCAVISQPGKHDWPFAARVFATSLPWLAGAIGTPGVARIPFQTPPAETPTIVRPTAPSAQAAAR